MVGKGLFGTGFGFVKITTFYRFSISDHTDLFFILVRNITFGDERINKLLRQIFKLLFDRSNFQITVLS